MAGLKKQKGLQASVQPVRKKKLKQRIYEYRWFYLMFLPVFLTVLIYGYFPMIGILYAFTEYTPFTDPVFIGVENFKVAPCSGGHLRIPCRLVPRIWCSVLFVA